MYETPTDWKSEVWWRNRPLQERLWHIHPPKYLLSCGLEPVSAPTAPDNYYVHGDHSFVKSKLAKQLIHNLVSFDMSGRWIEADDYIEMLKDSFDDGGGLPIEYSTPYLIKYIKGVFDVIVLDGLGEERLTEFAQHEIGTLVKKRFERGKLTIITSALHMDEAKHRYKRLAPILSEFTLIQTKSGKPKFDGED